MWVSTSLIVLLSLATVVVMTLIKNVNTVSDELPLSAFATTDDRRMAALEQPVSRRSIKNACHYIVDLMDLPRTACHERSYERHISGPRVQWNTRVRSDRRRILSWSAFRKHLHRVEQHSSIYIPAPILNAVFEDLCS